MSLLLERASAPLEGEEFLVPDAREPLPWASARAYLHPAVEADVVDDVDAGERKVGIGSITVAPTAGGAAPGAFTAGSSSTSAEGAGTGKVVFRRHHGRLRAASDTPPLLPGARHA